MIEIKNITRHLAEQAKHDSVAGIAIARLLDDNDCSFFVTEIASGKAVSPHYHQCGSEIYFIVSGSGVIYTAKAGGTDAHAQNVQAGDIFSIPANTAHQLKKTGDTPLILLFAGHPNHLDTDRYLQEISTAHFNILAPS